MFTCQWSPRHKQLEASARVDRHFVPPRDDGFVMASEAWPSMPQWIATSFLLAMTDLSWRLSRRTSSR
jgi:hypothetical protein